MPDNEEPSEETLAALNKALGPPEGDVVITVESDDRDLLNALWDLQGEGVEVQERLQRGVGDPGIVYLIHHAVPELRGGVAVLGGIYLKRTLDFIRSLNGNDKKHSKTRIRSREFHVELRGFVLNYKDAMDVEVEEPKDDEEKQSPE